MGSMTMGSKRWAVNEGDCVHGVGKVGYGSKKVGHGVKKVRHWVKKVWMHFWPFCGLAPSDRERSVREPFGRAQLCLNAVPKERQNAGKTSIFTCKFVSTWL